MICISLHQPFASLISVGAKRFETRTWVPHERLIGQRIAIHAAKRLVPASRLEHETKMAINKALGHHWFDWRELPRGAFLCTALFSNAFRVEEVLNPLTLRVTSWVRTEQTITLAPGEEHFGDYGVGRWLWEMQHVEAFIKPIQALGRQGLWEWTPEDLGKEDTDEERPAEIPNVLEQ